MARSDPTDPVFSFRRYGCSVSLAAAGAMCLFAETGLAIEPAGVYGLLPAYNTAERVRLEGRPLWDNPALQGVTVRAVWKYLQPSEKALDWSFFDEAIRLAASHHKKLGLSVAAGIFTPEWVYHGGAQRFDFMMGGQWRTTEAATMPEPWDPLFQQKWGDFVSAMGKKYDTDPNVAYVMVAGIGFSIESYYVKTPEDVARLEALGGAESWLRGSKQIIDLYAEAFPHKPFVLAMAPPLRGPAAAAGTDCLRRLVEYGMQKYPGRFGVMYHALNAVADPSLYQYAAVQKYSGLSPTGFQMVWRSEGAEGKERMRGTLAQALDRATALKAHFVEVYAADCADPAQQEKLSEANRELIRNAASRSIGQ